MSSRQLNSRDNPWTAHYKPYYNYERAQRRLKGEDVEGYKIDVSNPMATTNAFHKQLELAASTNIDNTDNSDDGGDGGEPLTVHMNSQRIENHISLMDLNNDSKLNRSNFSLVKNSSSKIRSSSYNRAKTTTGKQIELPTIAHQRHSADFLKEQDQSRQQLGGNHGRYFRSISQQNVAQQQQQQGVELFITNLDPCFEVQEIRAKLTEMLRQYVMILNLSILTQSDGSLAATIRVGGQQEAQYAISQLHHSKLGYRRINISYVQPATDPTQLKELVVALLREVPDHRMPLFKLIELIASRYHTHVSVFEINRLKDICRISDEPAGRIISLSSDALLRHSASYPSSSSSSTGNVLSNSLLLAAPSSLGGMGNGGGGATSPVPGGYCSLHCGGGGRGLHPTGGDIGWAETHSHQLPNLQVTLAEFTGKVHAMLTLHMGTVPLLSFEICYREQFSEELPVDEGGVPLEHLVTCVENVQLIGSSPDCITNKSVKYIVWQRSQQLTGNEREEVLYKGMSREICQNTQLLCRELVDLLKTTERCQLPLNNFIPMYHHHFGRQCRVATYGFTRLVDLLESEVISSIVHIMGSDDTVRIITLTQHAQLRRFTAEVLRMLKSQSVAQKSVSSTEFAGLYERTFHRAFRPADYGLCRLEDLLGALPANTFVIGREGGVTSVTIPRKEQSKEEMWKTKQFALEVVKLLRHSPYCKMLFNKFVPAYHHHFGHQCKVADYGFGKLIELFEAIPETVKIEELAYGERTITLTLPKALEVLCGQLADILRKSMMSSVSVLSLSGIYMKEYGYPLKPELYECSSIPELVSKLDTTIIKVAQRNGCVTVELVDSFLSTSIRCWVLLLNYPHSLPLNKFISQYWEKYKRTMTYATLEQLGNVLMLSKVNNGSSLDGGITVQLTALYQLAARLYHLLYRSGGEVAYHLLPAIYQQMFGGTLTLSNTSTNTAGSNPSTTSGSSVSSVGSIMEELLAELSFLLVVRGSPRAPATLALHPSLGVDYGVPLPLVRRGGTGGGGGGGGEERAAAQWPQVMPEERMGMGRRVSPPKPDTPPTPEQSSSWGVWETPVHGGLHNMDISIPFPAIQTPKLLGNIEDLLSPTRYLLSASHNIPTLDSEIMGGLERFLYGYSVTANTGGGVVTPPPARDIPKPDSLLLGLQLLPTTRTTTTTIAVGGNVTSSDDSNDSGVANYSNNEEEEDEDNSKEQMVPIVMASTGAKRKLDLNKVTTKKELLL